MANIPLSKSKHMLPFAAVLRKHGVSVRRLLKKANLPVTCLDDPDTLIPGACEGTFRELAAKQIDSPNISIEATRHLEIEDLGDFGRRLLMEPTVGGSLIKFRELAGTESSMVVFDLDPKPNGDLWFGLRLQSYTEPGDWHNNLYIIALMLKTIQLANPNWSPSEILIGSKATRERYESIEMLESTVRFEQNDTGFLIPESMLALPVTNNTAQGKNIDVDLWPTAPTGTYGESLKQMIRSYASDFWLNIDQASEVTNTSVRTLQRRLSTEHNTYSNLVRECRAEMAGDLLENTDAAIAEIAHQLGYGNQGNFTRAFYHWAKVAPSEFRKHRTHGLN